jgi:hypothetical protein
MISPEFIEPLAVSDYENQTLDEIEVLDPQT